MEKFVALILQKREVNSDTIVYLPYRFLEVKFEVKKVATDRLGRNYEGLYNIYSKRGILPEFVYLDYTKPFHYKGNDNNAVFSDMVRGYVTLNENIMYVITGYSKPDSRVITHVNMPNVGNIYDLDLRKSLDMEYVDGFTDRMQYFSCYVAKGEGSKDQIKGIGEEVDYYKKIIDNLSSDIENALSNNLGGKLSEEAATAVQDGILPRDLYYEYDVININELYDKITKTLIGQDEAVRRMLTEIARLDMDSSQRDGILLSGPSGTGKTLLMSLISKYLERPFLLIDATQLSVPGRAGKHIEQYLWDLYIKCDRSVEKAERAIVFFDEIDKKSSKKTSEDNNVLDILLKFLDGTVYTASSTPSLVTDDNSVRISTANMIVIGGGAFSEVFKKNSDKKSVGFITDENTNKDKKDVSATTKDFIVDGGMTNEYMGRNPIRIRLNSLDLDLMRRIILESDHSALSREQERFELNGVKLAATPDYIDEVATRALKLDTGARAISGIILESTWEAYYDVNSHLGKYSEIILDKETIDNPKCYVKIEKDRN